MCQRDNNLAIEEQTTTEGHQQVLNEANNFHTRKRPSAGP